MSTYIRVRKYGGKALLGLIILSAIGSAVWYRQVTGEREVVEATPAADQMASGAQMITRDFRHVETRMNRTAWILEADVAEVFERKARLQRVKITWYGDRENPVVITGRRASVDLEKWDAVISGDVRAVTEDGSVLKTRRLEWDNEEKLLRAPWPVKMRSRNLDLRGRMMVADIENKWVRIDGRVTSVLRPPADFFEPSG